MMNPICVGRNSYLFCGSEEGVRNATLIYRLIETCKMDGVRPVNYITETLRKLIGGETDYKALLPVFYAE
jgi:hypothetical protein